MAGVALGDIDLHFASRRGTYRTGLALVTRLGPVCRRCRRGRLRGRRAAVCVAGVALGDIDLHLAWQAWHLRHWAGSGDALGSRLPPLSPRPFAWQTCGTFAWQAWHLVTSTFTLRGRRGTYGTGPRLPPLSPRPFAWQAWHLVTSTVTLHGRRDPW